MKTLLKLNLLLVLFSFFFSMSGLKAQNCNLSGFVTYTQGGWGGPSNGGPGKIRDANFSLVFPQGLTVGGLKTLTLSSVAAVQVLLPTKGTAGVLTQNYSNASSTNAGVFAGQVVSLSLNVAFDRAGVFGVKPYKLEELVVVSGAFAGKTVGEILALANTAIGGSATGYSITALNTIVDQLNNNFDNGTQDLGAVTCPTVAPASLGNRVWNDDNKNGIQDNGETNASGITVQLYDNADNLKSTTTTDVNGLYLFSNIAPGTYYVKFTLPGGYLFSPKDQGTDDIYDSDADGTTGKTVLITLISGQTDINQDAGIYKPAPLTSSVGDKVWNDVNRNGIQDNGETGVPAVTVRLYTCADSLVSTKSTDVNGNFLFEGLTPRDYYVAFSGLPADYFFTKKNAVGNNATDSDADSVTGKTTCVTLTGGQVNLSIDAGIYYFQIPKKSTIGDNIWNDANGNGVRDNGETGMQGITVQLYDCTGLLKITTTTDANGIYLFGNLDAGNYYITVLLPDGYTFTNNNAGSNSIVDSVTGKSACFQLSAGQDDITKDAGLIIKKASIGDKVWNDNNKNGIQDNNEPGLPNITVSLYSSNDVLIGTKTTDQNGSYSFNNLMPGNYYVKFTLPQNYAFSPAYQGSGIEFDSDPNISTGNTVCVNLSPGMNDMSWDAGMYAVPQNTTADLSITKNVSSLNPKIGDNITYTITINNNGPSSATNIKVTDFLRQGLDFVSVAPSKGSYNDSTGDWTIDSLVNQETANLVLTVNVNPNTVSATAFDLGAASDFNLFVFEDLTQPSSDTQGKVAVGHDANLANYSIGDQLANSNGQEDVLIVGNNLTFKTGRIFNGNVVYGNSTNLPLFVVSIEEGALRKDTVIDFISAKNYLQSLSTQVSQYAENGTTKFEWTQLILTGNDPFLNVFNVKGSDMSNALSMEINVPNGAVVLVNIDGQTVKWSGGLEIIGTSISNVLYNFYQTTSLVIKQIDVRGSVLAPFADLNFVSGQHNGQMICKSMTGQGQFNICKFIGNIPSSPSIVNFSEIAASDQHDPDSAPGNGIETEDDYAIVTITVNPNSSTAGGVGTGSGNTKWDYVGNFSGGEIIWKIVTDNSGNLIAGTWGGKIYRSTDNGLSWTRINPSMSAAYIWTIVTTETGKIFTGTEKGIFVTADNGATWNTAGLEGKDVRALAYKSGELYAGTWGFGVFKSTDGGATWTEVFNGPGNLAVHALTINSKFEIFAGSFDSGIYKSVDHGTQWTKVNMPFAHVWAMECAVNDVIYAGTYGDGVYISNDGFNFQKANNGLTTTFIYAITANSDGRVFISSWTNGVYATDNGGSSWNVLGLKGFNVSSISLSSNAKTLYVGTSEGAIYKNQADVTAVDNGKTEIPATFELMQNFPNPFNPATSIKFSVPAAGRYALKVYDILGKEVAALVNGEVLAGKHTVSFDGA
ncbi:MAG: SdrD B-like domain-containing protein, partial [Ignavibacteria bacterium]